MDDSVAWPVFALYYASATYKPFASAAFVGIVLESVVVLADTHAAARANYAKATAFMARATNPEMLAFVTEGVDAALSDPNTWRDGVRAVFDGVFKRVGEDRRFPRTNQYMLEAEYRTFGWDTFCLDVLRGVAVLSSLTTGEYEAAWLDTVNFMRDVVPPTSKRVAYVNDVVNKADNLELGRPFDMGKYVYDATDRYGLVLV